MATSPINDPYTHLTAMVGQLVRQNQTLIGHIDRIATGLFEVSQDGRVHHASLGKSIGALRDEFLAELRTLRSEVNSRFDAVGHRFDDLEERTTRLERSIENLRSDFLRLENGLLNAQQFALQAHIRIDQGPADPSET